MSRNDAPQSQHRRRWLRTYAIAMTGLAAFLILAGMLTAWNVYASSADPTFALATSGSVPDWWRATMLCGGIGLALGNLVVGALRTGTPATPATGAAAFWAVIFVVQAAYGVSGAFPADNLANATIMALWFAAAAFLPYAIGRYGLRRLAVEPNPATRTGRMLLRSRRNPIETGCWIALACLYGLLAWLWSIDQYGWATALYLIAANTVGMLAIAIIAAAANAKPWRLVAVGFVAQAAASVALIDPIYTDGCPTYVQTGSCMALPNGWDLYLDDLPAIATYCGIPLAGALIGLAIGTAVRMVARRRGRM